MRLQHYHFDFSPARLVRLEDTHSAEATSVKDLINKAGETAKKPLDANEQKILDEKLKELSNRHADKRGEVIHWSTRERDRFAQEVTASISTSQNGLDKGLVAATNMTGVDFSAGIQAIGTKLRLGEVQTGTVKKMAVIDQAITREIEQEIHQKNVDNTAKNYIGPDSSPADLDANAARQMIDDAYRAAATTLNPDQRKELQKTIIEQTAIERKDGHWLVDKVNYKGAGHIVDAINKKAEELKKGVTTPAGTSAAEKAPAVAAGVAGARAVETGPAKLDTLTAGKKAAEELAKPYAKPEWCNADTPPNQRVVDGMREKNKNIKELIEASGKIGITVQKASIDKVMASVLSACYKEDGITGSNTIALAEKISKAGWTIVNFFKNRYESDAPKAIELFKQVKKIDLNDPQQLVEYLAFGDVAQDLKNAEIYIEAKSKEKVKSGEKPLSTKPASTAEKAEQDAQKKVDEQNQPKDLNEVIKTFKTQGVVAGFKALFSIIKSWFTSIGGSATTETVAETLAAVGATEAAGKISSIGKSIESLGKDVGQQVTAYFSNLGEHPIISDALDKVKVTQVSVKDLVAQNANLDALASKIGIDKTQVAALQTSLRTRAQQAGIDLSNTPETIYAFIQNGFKSDSNMFTKYGETAPQPAAAPVAAPAPAPAVQPPAKPVVANAPAEKPPAAS